ncbi:hypothetical protein Tco_1211487 [Tanacetum coccineum]
MEPSDDGARARAYVVVENPQQNPNVVTVYRLSSICYEKIVCIPLPNGEILKVQGERPEKDLGSLACIKADRKKLMYITHSSEISPKYSRVICWFTSCAKVEFRIDLTQAHHQLVRSPYSVSHSNVRIVTPKPQRTSKKRGIEPSYDIMRDPNTTQEQANVVQCLRQKSKDPSRTIRAMSITIHSGLRTKILEAHSEASKDLKAPANGASIRKTL